MEDMFSLHFLVEPDRIHAHWSEAHSSTPPPTDLIFQAEAFAEEIKREWERNHVAYIHKLRETTGILVDGEFTIYVLPPILDEAQYLNKHEIEWGHRPYSADYISRGICHEILHCLTHDFYEALSDDEKWVFHAFIYLSVDEEFYRHFQKAEDYFASPHVDSFYHPRLIETAKILLPIWKQFIANQEHGSIYDIFNEVDIQKITDEAKNF